MASEECVTQWNKTGDIPALRNRKNIPPSQNLCTTLSKDKSSQTCGHLSDDETHSSNGTSSKFKARRQLKDESSSRVFLMLVVGLSFSTRLYKITEPPHVW